ncbi:endonuclease/exonuclease/phosphatase family protein [Bacillus sp. RG28]|uniref:Endonuclease/exonuclease/phosphatase family protein n=1 Tax=Gottfriedia endophytica TaxID=2820819 RepID=A0A940NN71_9BACI|nr:endonuclease/exonuclease/phosphatase family protein [Gottfriedia endophytica]MBP0725706.1 endonuclease/exonuclease/phosphatase family protein [Gottfriedia endophytica]
MIKILKWLGYLIVGFALLFAGFLAYVTITDYKPAEVLPLSVKNNKEQILKKGQPFSITTFNIGYAGLDKNEDFFMDGGTMSGSSSKKQTMTNLKGITSFITNERSDINLIQEIDKNSTRSYHINEVNDLTKRLPDYSNTFAVNYKVPWVPVPIFHPLGSANSGLLTLSKFKISDSHRYKLAGQENWPRQQFDLDRAFIESRMPVDNGKELVLINLHLSAYDKGGKVRKQQLKYLSAYLNKEIQKGNYIILGGDWNHAIPTTDPYLFPTTEKWPDWLQKFPSSFKPAGFQWVADKTIPSTRSDDYPFKKGRNFQAVIDGFLVSPNITVKNVKGHDLGFENSDHNPVTAELVLQ